MSMFFKVSGFGNFSETYGWDDSLSLSDPKHITAAQIELYREYTEGYPGYFSVNTDKAKCSEVQFMYINEHGGSREVEMLVKAMGYQQASERAREFADAMYPCKGM